MGAFVMAIRAHCICVCRLAVYVYVGGGVYVYVGEKGDVRKDMMLMMIRMMTMQA